MVFLIKRIAFRQKRRCTGVVRLTNHELASRRRSRLSRRKLTPLGQGGRPVLFEDVVRVDVAVVVEVVVDGIVRVIERELADRRLSRLSRGELTPFRECGSAVLFEDVAAVEVAVAVEVVVDRGVGGGKLLESFHVPELRHRSFSSSERLV